jgi:hypothetical protein
LAGALRERVEPFGSTYRQWLEVISAGEGRRHVA